MLTLRDAYCAPARKDAITLQQKGSNCAIFSIFHHKMVKLGRPVKTVKIGKQGKLVSLMVIVRIACSDSFNETKLQHVKESFVLCLFAKKSPIRN